MLKSLSPSNVSVRTRIAALAIGAVVPLVNWILPAITGILARDLGFGAGMLGAFGSAEGFGGAGGALCAIAVMRYAAPRATVIAGLVLLLTADIGSAGFGWGPALVALRAMGGFGTGLVGGACSYVYGLDPERNVAAAALGTSGMGIVAMIAIPAMVAHFGWQAMFVCLALPIVPAFFLSQYVPSRYQGKTQPMQQSSAAISAPRVLMWIGLGATASYCVAASSFWTYVGRLGAVAGISEPTIATTLSICAICSFLGLVLVIALGERLAGMTTITLVVIINVIAAAAARSSVPWVFASAICAFDFCTVILGPAMFGLLMRRAPAERFAVYLGGAGALAFAVGPAIGGLLIEQYGFGALQWLNVMFVILAGTLLWVYSSVASSPLSVEPNDIPVRSA